MDREGFFKEGVLTDDEYDVISKAFDSAEEQCNDIMCDLREIVAGAMNKLWEKKSCIEYVSDYFTIINRFGDITIIEHSDIIDGAGEISLDEIESVDKLMDIAAQFI